MMVNFPPASRHTVQVDTYIHRGLEKRLIEALEDTPVVVLQGPRQCGKTTLVRRSCDHPYVTFDDAFTLAAVSRNPDGWLAAQPPNLIIDEIQRAPQLLRAIKKSVDQDRRPGRYVLTGSADVLFSPKVGDSLAGRMEILTLWPLAMAEIAGSTEPFLQRWKQRGLRPSQSPIDFDRGGFPEPVARSSDSRRRAWFQSYVRALMDRDVRDLAQIEGLALLPNLLGHLASQPYEVLNVSHLSRETGIPATSLNRYLNLLEAVYLVRTIPAYRAVEGGKSGKTPRIAFTDHGLWRYLSQDRAQTRSARESLVAMELIKQASWTDEPYEILHFRSLQRFSVPIVIAQPNGELYALGVTDSPIPAEADFQSLEFFARVAGDSFRGGLVLTSGNENGMRDEIFGFAPLSSLWST